MPKFKVQFTRADLVRYAGASGDLNIIHWNERTAVSVGLPGVIAHGMLTMGLGGGYVTSWVGDPAAVTEYNVRFTAVVPVPNDGKGAEIVEFGKYASQKGERTGSGKNAIAIVGGEGAIVTGRGGGASFGGGTGTLTTSTFTFSSKTTVPTAVTLRATEVSPGTVSSSNGTAEGAVSLRSGRLKLFNAFGSEKSPLVLQAQTQYWSGKGWVINTDDSCTTVPSSAVAMNAFIGNTGSVTTNMASLGFTYAAPSALSFSGGIGTLTLGAPSNGSTGSFDLALNLGATAADQSCLSNHNASTGANRAWLRGQNGNCTSAADRDPSARATFGVFSPESTKSIHVRDLF